MLFQQNLQNLNEIRKLRWIFSKFTICAILFGFMEVFHVVNDQTSDLPDTLSSVIFSKEKRH